MQKNVLVKKEFVNQELNLKVRATENEDGSISINAEDTAIGFGWYEEKNNKVYPRWRTLNRYIKDLGISQEVAKDDYIPESLFYRLGMKANNKVAEEFQNWLAMEVIPSIRKHGSYTIKKANKEEFEMQLLGAEYSARILRMDTTSQIKMLETVHKNYGVPTNHLPAYVDEEVTKSLTALLKENGFTQRAAEVNTILIAKGFMEIKERPNIKKGVKEFKSLTEKGLRYGKNIISPRQPKETQPHFYQSTFMELMEAIGLVEGSVSA